MGITMGFYIGQTSDVLSILEETDDEKYFEKVKSLTYIDFSFHLRYPNDINSLFQHLFDDVWPSVDIDEMTDAEVWADGYGAILLKFKQEIVALLREMSTDTITIRLNRWLTTFDELNISGREQIIARCNTLKEALEQSRNGFDELFFYVQF